MKPVEHAFLAEVIMPPRGAKRGSWRTEVLDDAMACGPLMGHSTETNILYMCLLKFHGDGDEGEAIRKENV